MTTILSRIISTNETHVEIETTKIFDEYAPPFIAVLHIAHNGEPEETAKHFHDYVNSINRE